MKKLIFTISVLSALSTKLCAFCGFYVAKADASLFNNSSQVVLVRDGEHSTITMWSDFKGDVKDFALVVPVPVILQKNDIKVVERTLFDMLDAYSGPRMVEYYDQNPCQTYYNNLDSYSMAPMMDNVKTLSETEVTTNKKQTVKIEAKYSVGEYDILILSAKESTGLETWLTENGYKIPAGAADVLEPYIKSNMKFFVVKVNLDELSKTGATSLRPIQIGFNSPKFMLPIRLGMANSHGQQDMIVYALSKTGRVESTNYRTVKMPTDNKVPEFVKDVFGKFYADMYKKNIKTQGMNNVFLEYAWDISMGQYIMCDPCSGTPPQIQDLMTAGVNWLNFDYHYNTYNGNVFFTRMHVTYDRENFPQDLVFEETPNKENFQARYVITHPAQGPFDCEAGKQYLQTAMNKRNLELQELSVLTGWDVTAYADYSTTISGYKIPKFTTPEVKPVIQDKDTVGKTRMDKKQEAFVAPVKNDRGHDVKLPSDNKDMVETNEVNESNFKPVYLEDAKQGVKPGGNKFYYGALTAMSMVVALIFIQRVRRPKAGGDSPETEK